MDVRLIFLLVISHKVLSQETVNNDKDLPRKSCRKVCLGSYRTGAKCINGFCECSKPGYNKYTCLPDVGNCKIIPDNPSAVAIAKYNGFTQKLHSCVNNVKRGKYDFHVLSNYQGNVQTKYAVTTNVYIKGESSKPVVLVLSNYEPVKWIIHSDNLVKIRAVLMFSYYYNLSSVDVSDVNNSVPFMTEKSRISHSAPGNDSQDGITVSLLKYLDSRWGSVKSFSECYRADEWTLNVSSVEEKPKGKIADKSSAVTSCLNSKDCWVEYNFEFEDNWNDCHGKQYVRKTTYQVGKFVGVVLCSCTRYKLFLSDSLSDRFLNIADRWGRGQDHCEFIGSQTDAISIDDNFENSPGTTGYIRSRRGQTPVKGRIGGGKGPSWTGNYFVKWIECGVRIPGNSRVVLSSDTTTNQCQGTYCPSSPTVTAKCVDGYCVCNKTGYNYYTCLPDYAGCFVHSNKKSRAVPSYNGRKRLDVYGCINKNSLNLSPEVHVLGCYENINQRPPIAGTITVDVVGYTTKPVVLVLSSYEPVAWRINVPIEITIQKVMLYSYFVDKSSVSLNGRSKPLFEKSRKRIYGYGNDIVEGQTLTILTEIKKQFGHVTSFTGTYRADHWALTVGSTYLVDY